MAYKIKKIAFKNFKYIKAEENMELDIDNSVLVLLDGPNGYGKTTVFDAIELLLTGDIKSFNPNLLNRGSISKSILANNPNSNIIINCELINEDGQALYLKRVFNCNNQFNSEIILNSEIKSQEELENLLDFNKNIFDIGMYISQKESLEFLERKYGDRKETISGILDNSEILKNKNLLKEFETTLKSNIEKELNDDKKLIDDLEKQKLNLEEQSSLIAKTTKEVKYKRLFLEETYDFDKEELDYSLSYENQIKILEEIKELIKEYNQYKNSKKAAEIKNVLKLSNLQTKAIYYRNIIGKIHDNIDICRKINNIDLLLDKKKIESFKLLGELAGIDKSKMEKINAVIDEYKISTKKLSENEKLKNNFIEKRKLLWESYNDNIENNQWEYNKCPICGKKSHELESLFQQTQTLIEENNSLLMNNINILNQKIDNYFNEIQYINEQTKKQFKDEYSIYTQLEDCISVDITKLNKEIEILDNNKFIFNGEFNITKYNQDRIEVFNKLEQYKKQLGNNITEVKMKRYEYVLSNYYKNINIHKIEEIDDKILYIAFKYSDGFSKKIGFITKAIEDKKVEYDKKSNKFSEAEKTFCDFRRRYDNAYKEYQTKLIQKIRIPLYVYSGKVIQNYPMGLGVNISIKENQIIFQTDIKEDDIFNYLSMGQLNGVVLSIMLAVRSTLSFDRGLDIIMIDDPLQSIDDISAFSFADLLAESFSDSQVILSTHEEDKSNLFEFKFKQHRKVVKTFNMHDKYIKDKIDK